MEVDIFNHTKKKSQPTSMRFESGDSFEQLRSFAGQASAIGAQLCKNMFVFVFVFFMYLYVFVFVSSYVCDAEKIRALNTLLVEQTMPADSTNALALPLVSE